MRTPVTLLVLAAGPLWAACSPSPSTVGTDGYWSVSCVSGDGRHLIAGGDHAALVDLSTGQVTVREPGMVKAVGCDTAGGVVAGYGTAIRLPGRTAVDPVPKLMGDAVVALSPGGAWISQARTITGGRWRGPASVVVDQGAASRRLVLLPARFGPVGAARALPTPDSFAVRFGNVLEDGRLILAAGWQPSRSGGRVDDVPWGFFALDLASGVAEPLTEPLASDAALNQAWFQMVAASPDGAHLAVAAHDGTLLTVGRFERGSKRPAGVTRFPALGSPSAVAVSADGAFVALGIETRGRDTPARGVVIDRRGVKVWEGRFRRNVAGAHFLPDGGLVFASGEGRVVRVPLPAAPAAAS